MSKVGVFSIFKGTVIARKRSKQSEQWDYKTSSLIFIFVLANVLSSVESRIVSRNARSLTAQKSFSPYIVDARVDSRSFNVYWNSPTFQCNQYGIYFDELTNTFGLKQNRGDTFRGDSISILYDPGKFPALLENETQRDLFRRNGGVPQEGSLKEHLDTFSKHIEELIPDGAFSGIGVIDFESWRPVFRQNFGKLTPYKDVSYQIERERHSLWPRKWIEKEAARRFEESGRPYVEQTLALAKEARPLARWGYYAYPYCFNMNNGKNQPNCPDEVVQENNNIQWLWDESDILLPSVYMGRKKMDAQGRLQLVRGRVTEALRLAKKSKLSPTIYPYVWYKYNDDTDVFLTKEDLYNTLNHMNKTGLAGAIIWGSSNDVSSKKRCLLLKDYVKNVLGPVVRQFVPMGSHKYDAPLEEADLKTGTLLSRNDGARESTFLKTNSDEIKSIQPITNLPDTSYVNDHQKRSTHPETTIAVNDDTVSRTTLPTALYSGSTLLYAEEDSKEIEHIPQSSRLDTISTVTDYLISENTRTAPIVPTYGSSLVASEDVSTTSDKSYTEVNTSNTDTKTTYAPNVTSLSSDRTVSASIVPTTQQSVPEGDRLLATRMDEPPSTFTVTSNIPNYITNRLQTDKTTPSTKVVSMITSPILEGNANFYTESDTTIIDTDSTTSKLLVTVTIEPSSEISQESREVIINGGLLTPVQDLNSIPIETGKLNDDSEEVITTAVNSTSVWEKIRKFFKDAFK